MQAQSATAIQRDRGPRLAKPRLAALICSLGAVPGWQVGQLPGIRTTYAAVDSAEIRTALCRECRITLDSFARIGGPDAGIPLVPLASLAVTSKGEIIVGAVQTGGEVSKLSSHGRFEGTLNRTGSGPGQLPYVTHLAVGGGDTVFVIDAISRLMNRVTSTGKFLDRTFLPGGILNVLPIGGRRLFTSANVPSRAEAGYPLHVLDTAGVVASFGNEVDVTDPLAAGGIIR